MKVIIAGGRDFENYKLLKLKMDYYLKNVKEEIIIISGKAKGADTLGEKYAREKGYKVLSFPAKWDDIYVPGAVIKENKYGKEYNVKAGMTRNKLMLENGDVLVAFWNKQSSGTKHMIDIAKEKGLKVRVVTY